MPVFFFFVRNKLFPLLQIYITYSLSANVAILKVLVFGVSFCQLYPVPLSVIFVYSLCLNFEQLLSIFVPLIRGICCITSEMMASKINNLFLLYFHWERQRMCSRCILHLKYLFHFLLFCSTPWCKMCSVIIVHSRKFIRERDHTEQLCRSVGGLLKRTNCCCLYLRCK